MDVLTLCWTFDSRWVFNIDFKMYMLWVPAVVDLLTLITYSIEDTPPGCCSTSSSQVILGMIILGHISLVGISYWKTLKMRGHGYCRRNHEQISKFIYR